MKFIHHTISNKKAIKALTVMAYILILLSACNNSDDSGGGRKPVYVKPSIDYKGKFRKGPVRMPVSTSKNAIKN